MSFSWVGAANYLKERRQREFERELIEQKRKDDITKMLLPTLVERISERKKVARQKEAVYKKGLNLFGKDTATALENMGALEEVVSQYKGTEADRGWANAIVARVGEQIDELLKSDDPEKQKLGADLLKRGSQYSEADLSDQDNFLSEALADGYISYEEFFNFEPPSGSASVYTGTVPDLGKPKTYSAEGLNSAALQLAGNLLGDAADLYITADGRPNIKSQQIDPRVLAGVVNGIKTILEENQYQYGTSGAEKIAIESFDQISEKYGLSKPPEGTIVPNPTGAQVQEAMGNPDFVTSTEPEDFGNLPSGGVEQDYNDFAPGVLDETSNRGFR